MALWPNGRYMTRSTYKGLGPAPGLDAYLKGNGDRMNRFVGSSYARTASTPDGYGMAGHVPAIRAGSMSALQRIVSMDGSANLLQGGPMEGSATVVEMTGDAGLSMIVSMSGTSTVVTLTGENLTLALTIGLGGTGSMSITGSGALSMIVPFEGTGSIASLTGTSDLRGILSLEGAWTPFTELSPQGLANAVLDALLASHNVPGSVGAALAAAGSAGDPWSAVIDGELARVVLSNIQKVLRNRTVTNPATGKMTVYDDDGTTVLFECDLFQDVAGATPYQGKGAERRERLA